jgi:zinc protease
MKTFALSLIAVSAVFAQTPQVVALPGKSPVVNFRFVFRTGAAFDPASKPGAAALTAAMLSEGGTRDLTYKQILDVMFPMAARVAARTDKEMTTFSGATHVDNLEAYYKIFRSMLLEPGWRADDLTRLRDVVINFLRVSLRSNNEEELGKEVLYNTIYEGHPYGHHNAGTVSSLKAMAMEDLQKFYKANYTQANLTIGLAGGYPSGFLERVKKDFSALPKGSPAALKLPEPKPLEETRVTIVDKKTRSVAYSFGFPISATRGHPDYPALLVAQSYLGQHRSSGGRLFERIREVRGLNYGDYAYIEYFPRGMFLFEPDPNLGRQQQIFQVWIRPVEPPTAHFTLRLAIFELDRLINNGLTAEEFERTRSFLSKYVNLLTKTKDAELGYAIDSRYYRIPDYNSYIKSSLAKLTRDDVNRAMRKHLRTNRLQMVAISGNAQRFKDMLLSDAPSPMKYNAPKPDDILAEDKIVQSLKLGFKAQNVRIVPVDTIFE